MKKTVSISNFPGWRVAHWGGNLNNGANARLLNANFNNSSSNRNANIGSQLSCTILPDMETPALAEKNKFGTGVGSSMRKLCDPATNMKRYGNLFNKIASIENIIQKINRF